MDGNKKRVLPLNDAIGFRSLINGKPKFAREPKPHAPGVMSDICVLTVPARILREPFLQFNEMIAPMPSTSWHPHPSQIYMASVLWLKLTGIASMCDYSHILEHSFGYGWALQCQSFLSRFRRCVAPLGH
jgi:hypothetical protein